MSIYLDNNATTALDARVLEAMLPYLQGEVYGNPSSVHRYGRWVRGAIDVARQQVAALVGAHPSEVIFTASGTEANNLALRGVADCREPGRLWVSAIEHASLLDPARALARRGWQVDTLPVSAQGVLDVAQAQPCLRAGASMVSVMLANNETGAAQPVRALLELAHSLDKQTVVHTDASQAAGKVPVDFATLGVNLMTLSAHKLYGPLGAGALITDKTASLQAQILGGGQERGLRSGTENIAAIVGFGKAAELALAEMHQRQQHCRALRQRLEDGLQQYPCVRIFAEGAVRLPNTVQFGIAGFHGEATLMKLDCKGIAVSSGSACHAERADPSHVLLAMGVSPELALTAIRASVGKDTTTAEVDALVNAVGEIVHSPLASAALAANL
ncbi:MAG: cysteine desulfurase [Gammaproteobacteria bacterium]|nr:MAG: cysteine desulfurase [Gammaproteobacteria bacterium]